MGLCRGHSCCNLLGVGVGIPDYLTAGSPIVGGLFLILVLVSALVPTDGLPLLESLRIVNPFRLG